MDGDGDMDMIYDEYYLKNISATECVTMPEAVFSIASNGLTVEFLNESVGQDTDCRSVEYLWDFGDGFTSEEANPTHTFAEENTYNVCLTVEDIAGQNTYCEDVTVAVSAVGQRTILKKITVFPNPVSDVLVAKSADAGQLQNVVVEIISPLGEIAKRLERDALDLSAGLTINVSDLPNGLHTLRISSGGKFFGQHFLKIN